MRKFTLLKNKSHFGESHFLLAPSFLQVLEVRKNNQSNQKIKLRKLQTFFSSILPYTFFMKKHEY